MNIIVAMPTHPEHELRLKSACPEGHFLFLQDKMPDERMLESADVIIGTVPVEKLMQCRNLKLMQLSMAGSDAFAGKLPYGAMLSNASGAYGLAISEHMLGMLFMLMKKLYLYRDNQMQSLWRDEGEVFSIEGARVLTVGLGDIGGEFAKRCKLLGAYNIGIRRSIREKPEYMDEMHSLDEIDRLLPMSDIVALALPNGEASKGLMNEDRLSKMRHGAILLNVGRGSAVDTNALVKVLNDGHILAGLDVTDPEPLPKEHPLWQCPGVVITPHISGYYHLRKTHDLIIEIAAKNIENLISGRPIMNLVDSDTRYRKVENRF